VILLASGVRIYVATRPIDFRKGHDGLAAVVQETLGLDPFCGTVFVFRSKRADRIKVLVWDGTGLVLAHKRLGTGKFAWPKVADGTMKLTPAPFSALFEGLDWRTVRAERRPRPTLAG
jgi:transposase